MKFYGIYLAYAPTVNLEYQGLGRYLAFFLKAAARRSDIRFVVACPSWTRDGLLKLCQSEGLSHTAFDIVSLPQKPLLLRAHEWYRSRNRRLGWRHKIRSWKDQFLSKCDQHRLQVERAFATKRSVLGLMPWILYVAVVGIVLSPILVVAAISTAAARLISRLKNRVAQTASMTRRLVRLQTITDRPKEEALVLRLYRFMEHSETEALTARINELTHVDAWYSPTAFWPSFNRIKAPRVMCVPDVVLKEFPTGFARVGGDRFLENFNMVEQAIQGGQRFITYSSDVKWNTLIAKYNVRPDDIDVIPHAVNDLLSLVNITGFPDNEATSRRYAETLFRSALQKSTNIPYTASFSNTRVRFLIYPSQFRPSKNILNLLLAYQYLLKERYFGYKLILTGNPREMPEIGDFIRDHNLANDVLCLHGLTAPELAACYKLADLAVNPSLSEGGCPFTFSEALSVGTPVVMARIPVTEEIITDPGLQQMMLFDPYVWRDMADRIEWATQNLDVLLSAQAGTYRTLSQRTWDHVVDDHVEILKRISTSTARPSRRQP